MTFLPVTLSKYAKRIITFVVKLRVVILLFILLGITFLLFLPSLTLSHLEPGFRSFYQNEKHQNYLYENDPYHYLYEVESVLQGLPTPVDSYHVYFMTWFQRLTTMEVVKSMIYYSLILMLLTVLVTFLFLYRISSLFSAFLGTLFFIILLGNSGRFFIGFPDTDGYNILFPLLIIWLIYEAMASLETSKWKPYLLVSLGGMLIGIYSKTWHGWWYFFDLFLIVLFVLQICWTFLKESYLIRRWTLFFIFLMSSLGLVVLLHSWSFLKDIFLNPLPSSYFQILGIINVPLLILLFLVILVGGLFVLRYGVTTLKRFSVYEKLVMPTKIVILLLPFLIIFFLPFFISHVAISNNNFDAFSEVQELQQTPFSFLIVVLGGSIFSLFSVLGYVIFGLEMKRGEQFFLYAVFILSVVIAFALTLRAGRFKVLCLLPVVFGFAMLAERLRLYFVTSTFKEKHRKLIIYGLILPILMLLLLFPLARASAVIQQIVPVVDDNLASTFSFLAENTSSNSLVTTGWDYGYPIRALAQRNVLIDGGSQNTPVVYWVSRALTTSNYNLSYNIFTMLNCLGDQNVGRINTILNYSPQTIDLLNQALSVDEAQARIILSGVLPSSKIDELISITHCKPSRDNYILLSTRMLYVSSIYHLGERDFLREYECAQDSNAQEGNNKNNKSSDTCNFLSLQKDYGFSQIEKCDTRSNTSYVCNVFKIYLDENGHDVVNVEALFQGSVRKPHYFRGIIDGNFVNKEFTDYTLDSVIYVFYEGGEVYAMASSPELRDSLLVNLYFFPENNINHFEKVYATPYNYSQRSMLYKLD